MSRLVEEMEWGKGMKGMAVKVIFRIRERGMFVRVSGIRGGDLEKVVGSMEEMSRWLEEDIGIEVNRLQMRSHEDRRRLADRRKSDREKDGSGRREIGVGDRRRTQVEGVDKEVYDVWMEEVRRGAGRGGGSSEGGRDRSGDMKKPSTYRLYRDLCNDEWEGD